MKSDEFFKQTELHNGQQSSKNEQELIEAAKMFTKLTQKVFRENTDQIKNFETGNATQLSVLLRKHEIDGGSFLSVSVRKKLNREQYDARSPFKLSELILEEIGIQQIEDNRGREYLAYRLNADGIVRRWNGGDIYAKEEGKQAREQLEDQEEGGDEDFAGLTVAGNTHKQIKMIEKSIDNLINVDLPIARMEESLGYQNQPVGVDEIGRLAELIEEDN